MTLTTHETVRCYYCVMRFGKSLLTSYILANLRCVCKRLREITLLNEKMRSYLVFSKNFFDLDFNHHLTLFFESIFDRLGFNFNLPDMLHFRYRVFSLFEYFQRDQFLAHLFNCRRSEVSFSSCSICHYYCSITHLLVFVHQLIITLNLCFLKIFFHKRRQRFLMLRRMIGLVLTFFMEVKKFMTSSNLMSKGV